MGEIPIPSFFMFTTDFYKKLKKLNPNVYFDFENTHYHTNPSDGTCGIHIKERNDAHDIPMLGSTSRDRMEVDKYKSRGLSYLCYTNSKFVPETSRYNKDGIITSPGKREILHRLIEKRLIDKERAERVFQVGMLGQYDWDKMSWKERLECQT